MWPLPPDHWSFSTLTEAESCPLRYALGHASYSGASHSGSGYPGKTTEPALVGTVIHAAVEQVLRALRRVPDAFDPEVAIAALRELGGYTSVIERCIATIEERLSSNPRMKHRAARLGANLRRRTPEIRSSVQGLVARFPPAPVSGHRPPHKEASGALGGRRGPLAPGAYPESRLLADAARFKGQIDLLTVRAEAADIADFKSGRENDHHQEQILLYGLLWLLDDVANPGGLPVGTMTLAYAGSDTSVPQPDSWTRLEMDLRDRVAAADSSLSPTPPSQPSDACSSCSVRHMCEDYWRSDYPTVDAGQFIDIEAKIVGRRGPTSWAARLTRTEAEALLRTSSEDVTFVESSTVRLLDVVCERQPLDDGASETVVLTAVATSEVFEVDRP